MAYTCCRRKALAASTRHKLLVLCVRPLIHLRALLTREFISMTRNPADVAGALMRSITPLSSIPGAGLDFDPPVCAHPKSEFQAAMVLYICTGLWPTLHASHGLGATCLTDLMKGLGSRWIMHERHVCSQTNMLKEFMLVNIQSSVHHCDPAIDQSASECHCSQNDQRCACATLSSFSHLHMLTLLMYKGGQSSSRTPHCI
jgi:hypothetical protein